MPVQKRPPSNLVPPILENQSFPELAQVLRSQIDSIAVAWDAEVRAHLPAADVLTFEQLRDDLPKVLKMLSDALQSERREETAELLRNTTDHGHTRFHQGYNESELLIEYRLLRRIMVHACVQALARPLTTDEQLAMGLGLDIIVHQTVVAFTTHQKALLRSAAETEARFLAFLSHDLRNNLAAVMLLLQRVKQRLSESKELAGEADTLTALEDSIGLTVGGMQRLLEAERLRRGAVEPRKEPVDLHTVAAALAKQFAAQAQKARVRIECDVTPRTIVQSDRELIHIVLQNLLDNAIKYAPDGIVRLTCAKQSGNGQCNISVIDDGPGIEPEHSAQLFEAFRRGQSFGQPGVGLGLAIASQGAKLLGGELRLHSQRGHGATFELSLPSA